MSDEIRQEATDHVTRVKAFYKHLWSYVITNIVLLIINLVTNPNHMWFYWVTIFWGIGILRHAFTTFGPGAKMTKSWEKKKVDDYVEKHQSTEAPKQEHHDVVVTPTEHEEKPVHREPNLEQRDESSSEVEQHNHTHSHNGESHRHDNDSEHRH